LKELSVEPCQSLYYPLEQESVHLLVSTGWFKESIQVWFNW